MSEWDGFLERLARAICLRDSEYHAWCDYHKVMCLWCKPWLAVLRAKLVPLLAAGQAMRDRINTDRLHYGDAEAWDAALKGSDAETRQASD